MNTGIAYTGIPSADELAVCPGVPTETRMKKGRVAVIECVQQIPCNPCECACPVGAITIGDQITNLPIIDGEKCTGCGLCIVRCPGLAITVVNKALNESEASVDFPFEYIPLPAEGEIVDAVGRDGQPVCKGRILKVKKLSSYGGTTVISMALPAEFADTVRSMKRLPAER